MWRDSWAALTNTQLQVVTEYEGLYDPIAGASDGQSRHAVPTPQLQLERTFKLKKAYTELKAELVEEMALIEEQILKPATDARTCIAPIRKTIKKRENKRVDYEKAQDKTLKLQRKPGRNPKEEAALAKADAEMSRAADVSPPWLCTTDLESLVLTRRDRNSVSPTNISKKPCRQSSTQHSVSSPRCSRTW